VVGNLSSRAPLANARLEGTAIDGGAGSVTSAAGANAASVPTAAHTGQSL
jgi:hypothetical protein